MLSIYGDLSAWGRLTDRLENPRIVRERDEVEYVIRACKDPGSGAEMITTRMQIAHINRLSRNPGFSPDKRAMFVAMRLAIEENARMVHFDPYPVLDTAKSLARETGLKRGEDMVHMTNAWLATGGIFMTVDRKTILDKNRDQRIEAFFSRQRHPVLGYGRAVRICDPEYVAGLIREGRISEFK